MAKKDLQRIDFDTFVCNSDGEPIMKDGEVSVLFDKRKISEKNVKKLIDNNSYKLDKRIITTTPEQANILKGILDDEVLNMYQYTIYKENDFDYYTMGYFIAKDENLAESFVRENFPKDRIEIQLEQSIKEGTLIMGQRLES